MHSKAEKGVRNLLIKKEAQPKLKFKDLQGETIALPQLVRPAIIAEIVAGRSELRKQEPLTR